MAGNSQLGYLTEAVPLTDRRMVDGRPRLFASACEELASRPIRGLVATCDDEMIRVERVMRRRGSEDTSAMTHHLFFAGGFCLAREDAVERMYPG